MYRAGRLQRGLSNPSRYAKNRAKSKALKAAGVYRALNKWWRA
jgi:hypothetical protein